MARPPLFKDPNELEAMISLYEAQRKAEKKPMNVTDLALFLGFSSRQSLYDYKAREEFSGLLTRALTMVEEGHVDRVNRGIADKGNSFLLKAMFNFQEVQKVQVEPMTVNIEGKDAQL